MWPTYGTSLYRYRSILCFLQLHQLTLISMGHNIHTYPEHETL